MANDFDVCKHQITQLIIKAGTVFRKMQNLPEEKNITKLYNEAAPLLGMEPIQMNTAMDGDHLPAPHEMRKLDGSFTVPRKDCPQCGKKESMRLIGICRSCADSEGGKFNSMWYCGEQDPNKMLIPASGCGAKTDKSPKVYTQVAHELGVEIPTGLKADLGIKTMTDDGLK